MGRFITKDPIKSGLNWYVYCSNNPLSKIDPDGLDDVRLFYSREDEKLTMTYIGRTPSGGIDENNIVRKSYNATNNVRDYKAPQQFSTYYYYPDVFPGGTWNLGKSYVPGENMQKLMGPRAIRTDATRNVNTYDKNGTPTGKTVEDGGFSLHSGIGDWTWGCLKLSESDIENILGYTDYAIDTGGAATITVPDVDTTGESDE